MPRHLRPPAASAHDAQPLLSGRRQRGAQHREHGYRAEEAACQFLQTQGAHILARNVRYRLGEIDIIALHARQLVFIEVRLRRPSSFGDAAASLTRHKQLRILAAAQLWLAGPGRRYAHLPMRCDALLFTAIETPPAWLQAAFAL